ncbi:MAG: CopG family transcriptional regulator [Planctomycetes bacterium]|nr:CopG family transcriptional regulator [Planctomycetota bacterium]MBM4085087.1 CopG family transcriptional regulator [Planctomycetota bacterium]
MSKVTTVNLPPRLAEQVEAYVRAGWFPDVNALITEALRRYLESHRMELMEQFVLKDVEWGLRGND